MMRRDGRLNDLVDDDLSSLTLELPGPHFPYIEFIFYEAVSLFTDEDLVGPGDGFQP